MPGSAKRRALIACCLLSCGFTGFSGRLIHLQVTLHDDYAAQAAETHGGKQISYARRGSIQDISGQPLAQNDPVRTVVADGSLIRDAASLATALAGPLKMDEKLLLEKLSRTRWSERLQADTPSKYIVLKKEVPEIDAEALRTSLLQDPNGKALIFEPDSVRVYPNGNMLSHVIGFVNGESNGADGIERTMDGYLRGKNGVRYTEHGEGGRELVQYRGEERPARDGKTVHLTVDLGLQNIVETELDSAIKEYDPKMAIVIVMRPQTGEILAMANRPTYDLNAVTNSPMEDRRNRALTDMVEPGSTFKIVVTSAALHQKLVTPETAINTENGFFPYMGRILKDTHPYRELSVHDILVHSSNIGAAKLGIQLGDQRLYEYVRRFGFGERTGVLLPGEIAGLVHPVNRWSKLSISRIPMGQEVGVTPLQITNAMCVVANGGSLMLPQIVHEVTDADGNVEQAYPPVEVRRVVTPEVAKQVRDALIDVMGPKGTGRDIRVPGFLLGGKTGTAQKVGEHGIGYAKGKYVLSFLGFLPAQDPKLVCLVMIDEAKVSRERNYGGTIAGPIFAKIATRAVRHFGWTPTEPIDIAPTPGDKSPGRTQPAHESAEEVESSD